MGKTGGEIISFFNIHQPKARIWGCLQGVAKKFVNQPNNQTISIPMMIPENVKKMRRVSYFPKCTNKGHELDLDGMEGAK